MKYLLFLLISTLSFFFPATQLIADSNCLAQKSPYNIIFVHGISGGVQDWSYMANQISPGNYYEMRYMTDDKIYHNYFYDESNSGSQVWSVSYYSIDPLKESLSGNLTIYAHRLKKILSLISQLSGKNKFVLIGHSMGGLIAQKYMTLDADCWNSVHKFLAVGVPYNGVYAALGLNGQLKDLNERSLFLGDLHRDWEKRTDYKQKWGIIAGVNINTMYDKKPFHKNMTDTAGPGYVTVSSAIPFEEWKDAVECISTPNYNTAHFGFRLLISSTHKRLLKDAAVLDGIKWSISN